VKALYIDCGMGAAGDMLTAALYELLEDNEKTAFLNKMNSSGIPNLKYSAENMTKCGIVGTHMKVSINGSEEHEHHHEHSHGEEHSHEKNTHSHTHSSMQNIEDRVNSLNFSEKVKSDAISVYRLIAEAESNAHGVPVTDIHFHEVGTADAIADITAVCFLMNQLGVQKVFASPVHVGSGHVHCAHGILPVPAPATAYILRGVPTYGGGIKGELCTPTGAALLKYFVTKFGEMPVINTDRIGYGMGKKDFSQANCVRVMIGEIEEINGKEDVVTELICNIDDMSPEKVGFAMETLFDAGALEVYTTPVGMKKSRPGIMLSVLCNDNLKEEMINLIFKHTTTIGIRENVLKRYTLNRSIETRSTSLGDIRIKKSVGYGTEKTKYEYEDISKIAKEKGLSIDEVVEKIENE